jgi:hypothetical protein
MENDKRDVHDKDVGFKLRQIDISSITNFDNENYSYIFVLSCHGSELDAQRRTIANEDCFFNSIALGTRFGHLGYTDAHNNKAIPLYEENNWVTEENGRAIINNLSIVNTDFSNNLIDNRAYFIENLTTDQLPIITENDGQNIYTGLNPMTFEIKKSDYEGMLLDPNAIEQDPIANEAYTESRIYINAFGLWVYKCYKFKAELNDEKRTTIDLDIAINKRQLKGIYNDEELHTYFSNTENRNINTLTEENQLRIKQDIRSYMEPGQKCTWNILINMCYDAISELHTEQLYNDIYEKKWNLRVLCCREASGSVSSSTTSFVVNRDSINYTPKLIDDTGNDNFVPFMNNIISNEHIESIFNNLLDYLNKTYDAFKLVARTNNNNIVHFITRHHQLLLVFQLLTIINPIIMGDIYNNYNFLKLAFRIYTITIQNDQYDLFDALLTLTANTNSLSKRYSRKKVSLLGNPTNKRIYMEELLFKLNTVIDNNDGIAVGIQDYLRTYLIEALDNGGNSYDYPDAKFIIDSIIMLTKRQNFMDDYNENISSQNESDEDAMDIEEDYLAFDFGITEERDISTLIDDSQYLGLIGDDIFNNVYAQYIKYIHSEIDNFDSHICIYFTAAKEVNEENEKIEEAVFVFILDISDAFTNVVSYLIGLNNDSFMNSEEFSGVLCREDYTDRILNYKGRGVMFQDKYEDNNDIKILINNFVYYGCIIPLYRNGFNYIDLIYRDRNTMTGGGPIPKKKSVDPNHPLIINLDRLSDKDKTDKDKTDKSEYQLKYIPKLQNVNKVEFKDTFQRNKNFVSNDDIEKLPVNPDSIFPLGRFVKPLETPTDQGITEREPGSQHSDFIRYYEPPFSLPSSPGSPLSKAQSAPGNLGFVEDVSITDDETPFNTPSSVRHRPRTKPNVSAPELNVDTTKGKNNPEVTITRSPSMQEMEQLRLRTRHASSDIGKSQFDDDVGMDIEKPGGKKRKSKKLKVKRNKGKTKKKSVKKK